MKVLVIRFKQIGDVVLTSVLCSSIKQSFPDAQVDFVVHDISVPMLEGQSFVDNVIGLSAAVRKNPFKFLRKVRAISKNNYDIILDASSTARSGWFSLLSRQAKYRIGRDRGKAIHFYTHLVAEHREYKIDQRLGMLQPLIDDGFDVKRVKQLRLDVDEPSRLAMYQSLLNSGVSFERPIFVFSVSSRISYKRWKMDYHVKVAQHCIAKYDAQILLYSAAPHEHQDTQKFSALLKQDRHVFNNIATPTLRDLMAFFSHADIFIGNECGPMHIAQALGIPTVTVFSPSSDKGEWAPSNNSKFRSIECRDVATNSRSAPTPKVGSEAYQAAYDSIEPKFVIGLVDEMVGQHLHVA